MEKKEKNERLIDRLINKRKQENNAFMKLLSAIENKGNENHEINRSKKKTKP